MTLSWSERTTVHEARAARKAYRVLVAEARGAKHTRPKAKADYVADLILNGPSPESWSVALRNAATLWANTPRAQREANADEDQEWAPGLRA
jgi:hypothetical protein